MKLLVIAAYLSSSLAAPLSSYLLSHDPSTASPAESIALSELTEYFKQITDQEPVVLPPAAAAGKLQIAVGYSAAIFQSEIGPDTFTDFGLDGFVAQTTKDGSIVLSGSNDEASKGTLYSTLHFLNEIGVEWYASDEVSTPPPETAIPGFNVAIPKLPLEYRDNNGHALLHDADLAMHQRISGTSPTYAAPGFVHTSYSLLGSNSSQPPADLYQSNPEWFWPRDDPTAYGQLCWTNETLVNHLIQQVRNFLDASPDATIISVSQNDNGNYCNTTSEWAVIVAEQSPIGPLLRAVNAIADAIKVDYPHVAVDTLAYQYTRPAPVQTVPRDNVIIRLCSIECNFALPMSDESNLPFQTDIINWSKLTQRMYIWDYITNFGNYVMPFPNWSVLAENIRFFKDNGVVGVFEEGTYNTPGGDMEELKNYLLGKVMYDPSLDESVVVDDFLQNYFGSDGAAAVKVYMTLMEDSVKKTKFYMGENFDWTAPFLTPDAVLGAAKAFKGAEVEEGKHKDRLENAMLPIYYVAMLRWDEMKAWSAAEGEEWVLEDGLGDAFEFFSGACDKKGILLMNEWGNDLEWLKGELGL